jgi:hypothetical protein
MQLCALARSNPAAQASAAAGLAMGEVGEGCSCFAQPSMAAAVCLLAPAASPPASWPRTCPPPARGSRRTALACSRPSRRRTSTAWPTPASSSWGQPRPRRSAARRAPACWRPRRPSSTASRRSRTRSSSSPRRGKGSGYPRRAASSGKPEWGRFWGPLLACVRHRLGVAKPHQPILDPSRRATARARSRTAAPFGTAPRCRWCRSSPRAWRGSAPPQAGVSRSSRARPPAASSQPRRAAAAPPTWAPLARTPTQGAARQRGRGGSGPRGAAASAAATAAAASLATAPGRRGRCTPRASGAARRLRRSAAAERSCRWASAPGGAGFGAPAGDSPRPVLSGGSALSVAQPTPAAVARAPFCRPSSASSPGRCLGPPLTRRCGPTCARLSGPCSRRARTTACGLPSHGGAARVGSALGRWGGSTSRGPAGGAGSKRHGRARASRPLRGRRHLTSPHGSRRSLAGGPARAPSPPPPPGPAPRPPTRRSWTSSAAACCARAARPPG